MPHRSHFDVELIKNVCNKIVTLFPIKIILASFTVFGSWIFDGEVEILYTLYSLIMIDTLTGVWVASRKNILSSRGFYRVAVKTFIYFLMIVVGRLVDKHTLIPLAAPMMDTFLVSTEGFSILENVSELGFPVPQKLIKMFKIYYDKDKS